MRFFLTVLISILFLFTTGCVKSIREVPVSGLTDADADEQIDETSDNTEDDIILTDEDADSADEFVENDDESDSLDDDFVSGQIIEVSDHALALSGENGMVDHGTWRGEIHLVGGALLGKAHALQDVHLAVEQGLAHLGPGAQAKFDAKPHDVPDGPA